MLGLGLCLGLILYCRIWHSLTAYICARSQHCQHTQGKNQVKWYIIQLHQWMNPLTMTHSRCSYMWCYWSSTRHHRANGNTTIIQTRSNQLPNSGEGANVSAVNRFSRPQGQALDSLSTTHMGESSATAHYGRLQTTHAVSTMLPTQRQPNTGS